MQPPPRGQALLLVAEAQLTLLLRLALAGPPSQRSASAQKLFGLHALAKLSQCRAIDLQPEEPGFGQYSGECGGGRVKGSQGSTSAAACRMSMSFANQRLWWLAGANQRPVLSPACPILAGAASLRQRLHQLLTPLLRLVLAVVTALPSSGAVREQALAFVDSHARTLTRILHDAASPGVRQAASRCKCAVQRSCTCLRACSRCCWAQPAQCQHNLPTVLKSNTANINQNQPLAAAGGGSLQSPSWRRRRL